MESHEHLQRRGRAGGLATLLCAALLLAGPARAELVDGVAAVVGDEVILRSELDAVTLPAVMRLREERGGLNPKELRELRRRLASILEQ